MKIHIFAKASAKIKSTMSYLVGIAGGSASGKTSFLKALSKRFSTDELAIISQDNYYLEKQLQSKDSRGTINFDLPGAIDRQALYADINQLVNGKSVARPEYTFNNAAAHAAIVEVAPAAIIVIEGLFVYHFSELASMLDLKVYIDARDEVKLQRRLKRDATERGYPESDVLYRWEHHVMPCYRSYLMPYRDHCDLIVTNNESFDKGLEVLVNHLSTKL